MKLLYLSCHSILEYDELSLFTELDEGIQIFSPGPYVEPLNPGDSTLRPGIPGMNVDPEDVAAWNRMCEQVGHEHAKERLTQEFIDRFDAVMVMHMPDWISKNWQVLKSKKVIWRTIGQSISHQERQLDPCRRGGMLIARYSPMEARIPGYLGGDAMIRFGKDPAEFNNWNGELKEVLTVNQGLRIRASACNYDAYQAVTFNLPRKLYGPSNSDVEGEGVVGQSSFKEMKAALRNHRAYFYLGTHPASYTLNFIEAWMTGIPMVCLGPKFGHPHAAHPNHLLYEIPDLIANGINGFYSDDLNELHEFIKQLFEDKGKAEALSIEGRKAAISHFDKGMIRELWRDFFKKKVGL